VRTPRCVRSGKIQPETTASEPGTHLSARYSYTLLYPVFSVNKFELCCISQALHLVRDVDIKFEFEKAYGNILQIRETGFTSKDPMFEKS
jgi:hypothetical protein